MELSSDIQLIISDFENTNLQVKSWHWVHVTHILNPHHFYVRKTDYLPFIEKLESNKPLDKCSSINFQDLVIVEVEAEKYARGKVIQTKKEAGSIKCDIFLLDYGDIKQLVSLENIWTISQELRDLPPLTLLCQLGNCSPIGDTGWTKKTIDAFKFYVGTERARIYILDKSMCQLIVELYNTAPDDIATLLALTEYSTFGYEKRDSNN